MKKTKHNWRSYC